MEKIKLNQVECVKCGHMLQSLSGHDFRTHSCDPSIWFMVDGGNNYVRRGWKGNTNPEDNYIERTVYDTTTTN